MEITTTTDANKVWAALSQGFSGDPAVCNWILSAVSRHAVSEQEGFRYWMVHDNGTVAGLAVFSGASTRLDITPMDATTSAAMADAVFEAVADLGGVLGPAGASATFAGRWTELAGVGARPTDGGRVLEVRHLAPPPSTPAGEARLASGDDLELLVNWNAGFAADTDVAPLPDPAGHLSAQVQTNSAWVWEQYGVPSAMALRTSSAMATRRLAHVYTPPQGRGRGLAAALVTHLADLTLAAGDRCMLHTQLSNPSSNGIYRRLGFEAISESTFYEFLA